jgi:hypothetical protein
MEVSLMFCNEVRLGKTGIRTAKLFITLNLNNDWARAVPLERD